MNLSGCITTTTIEFSSDYEQDIVSEGFDKKRIIAHIDRLRTLAGVGLRAKISTKNSFPASAGIASSASGFAALTVAASAALGLQLSEKELSVLSRLGSGSACRSIPPAGGFVKWEDSFAYSLYPPEYWDLRDILVIVENSAKDVSSSVGHEAARTSPFFQKRLDALPERLIRCEQALKTKNFVLLGEVMEEDCLDMHHVMQTQSPPLFYWNEKTKQVIRAIKKSELPAYFTIDAGPNIHLICEAKDEKQVINILGNTYQIIVNKPARGAHII
jgi:diphosphomevalonate decarboxylase